MRCAACLLLGVACVLLVLTGCPCCEPDPTNPPVADPACSDSTGDRFVDCGNGTVTDTQTGLVWLKNANCYGSQTWDAAMASADGLKLGDCGLSDHSSAGNWRLPTKAEWEGILEPSCPDGSPKIPDRTGAGCYATAPWASGEQLSAYWSSITAEFDGSRAWAGVLHQGIVGDNDKTVALFVWPVRN